MTLQRSIALSTQELDLNRLVDFVPNPLGGRWECTEGSKRRGVRGTWIGNINLRHSSGYEIVLQLDDGSITSFAANALRPLRDEAPP